MILKFDHITYVESRENKKEILHYFRENGYQYKFEEKSMVNFPAKKSLMNLNQETHDIYYFEQGEALPVELILYAITGRDSNVAKDGKSIYVSGRNALSIIDCMHKLGFGFSVWDRERDIVRCNIKGMLDRQDYWLVINLKKERDEVFLDNRGYGCITFLVKSFKDLCNWRGQGNYLSEPAEVCVNRKKLQVVFYKNVNIDIFFEFYMLMKVNV